MNADSNHLIRGSFSFMDVVNIARLRTILEKYTSTTGFPTGVITHPDNKVLINTGWRTLCQDFHLTSSATKTLCQKSIQRLTEQLTCATHSEFFTCEHGLVYGATPIVIENIHIANLITGQVFFEKPEPSHYRKQAETFGFDPEAYIAAIEAVPVVTREKMESALALLSEIALSISEIGLNHISLKAQEEDLRATLYSIGDAVITTDTEGRVIRMNHVAEQLTGWPVSEACGLFINEIIKCKDPTSGKKLSITSPKQSLSPQSILPGGRATLVARNGVEYEIADSQSLIRDSEGVVTGTVLVFRDVTEEIEAQRALKESQERLELAVQGTGAGLWDWNVQTGECTLNERWAEIVGYTLEELEPISIQTWIDLCHPDDLRKSDELLKKHFNGDSDFYECEVRMKHKKGHWIWVQDRGCVAERDEDGLPLRMAGTHIDITHHKWITQKQQESETKYRTYVNHSPVAIFVVDEQGRYTDVNDAACDLLGYSRHELLKLSISDLVSAEDMESSLEGFRELIEKGQLRQERKIRRKDRTYVDVDMDAVALGGNSYMAFCLNITERKQAELMIRDNEEKMRGIVENSTNLFYSHTAEHELTYISPRSEHFLGCTQEEAKIRWTDFVTDNPANLKGLELTERAIQTGQPQQPYELELRRLDGETLWVEVHEGPIVRNGKTIAIVGALTDITERKRNEEAIEKRVLALTRPLEDAEGVAFEDMFDPTEIQLIQDLFAHATGVASIITRPDGTPITKPSNFCRLCNDIIRKTDKGCANCYKSDASIGRFNPEGPIVQPCLSGGLWDAGASITVGGRHIASWLIGQVRDETQDVDNMLAYAREIGADEEEVVEAFGEVTKMSRERFEQVADTMFVLANQLSRMAYQNIQQARFIADRKEAQNQLAAERKRLLETLDVIPAFIYLQAKDYTIRFANREFKDLFGDPGQQPCYKIIQNQDHPCEYCPTLDVLETGQRRVWEFNCNNNRIYKVYDSLFKDIDGTPLVLSMGLDITDQKEAEAYKERIENQLRQSQKMEAIGQLAGGVAHDFNNILTAILGNLELSSEEIKRELGEDHSLNLSIREIEKSAIRASSLTRQLLAFSRQQIIQPKQLDINAILLNLEPMLKRLVTENIELSTALANSVPPVRADKGQIEQIIINLTINAADAMPDGGILTLETQEITLDEVYVSVHAEARPGRHVAISVSDTGHGMTQETLERIFEPFFTTKSVEKGTGLGLATVHGIVKQSGGHINVYSELEKGSTFKIYLPVSEGEIKNVATPDQGEIALQGTETLLLSEDDNSVREMTRQVLAKAGYTVFAASSGLEALELISQHQAPIDMLITDVIMKDMNGRELSDKISQEHPGLPVLYISGYTANVIAHHGVLDAGVEFLEKPFSHTRLLTRIREILIKSRNTKEKPEQA